MNPSLSRGELKLTNKNATMGEVNEVKEICVNLILIIFIFLQIIEENDKNFDKKLCINEYRDFLEEEVEEKLESCKDSNNISASDQADLDRLRDFLKN